MLIKKTISDISTKIIWLMLARVLFTAILLGSTIYAHYRSDSGDDTTYIIALYCLVVTIFFLSMAYAFIAPRVKRQTLFTYIQFVIDVFIVTLIIFITGGFFSFFSFLYLVIIIYASMILYLKGGLFVAALSSVFYATLILFDFAFASVDLPLNEISKITLIGQSWSSVVFRIFSTTAACFAVAILSGLLTEQNRKSQIELRAMEANLKRVEKMAYMGEMAAGLAHEIKNPLASLVGSIQMFKDDLRYDADHERLMDIILRETDRLSTLVSDFLFFARPPAGNPEKVNLNRAIGEIAVLFEKDAVHAKRFRLQRQTLSDLWVLIDPTHLSQVLWNLLLNAAEAIEEDGEIVIRTQALRNGSIQIQVSDNGCGMAPDVAQSIFDPFYTTKPDGTGLGLSIVHRILESYDSRLDVASSPGQGTVVSFTLEQATNPQSA